MTTKIYKTRDMGLAAALIHFSYKYLGIEWVNDFGLFKFEDTGGILEKEKDYTYGNLMVSARTYSMALHTLRREITSYLKTNGK